MEDEYRKLEHLIHWTMIICYLSKRDKRKSNGRSLWM